MVFLFLVGILVYFFPAWVAAGKKNAGGVLVLNLFLGWTLVGWVVALAWAASGEPAAQKKSVLLLRGADGRTIEIEDDPRFCPYCGAHMLIGAPFCRNCGKQRP